MIVHGMKRTEEIGNDLFSGSLEECMEYCKELAPSEFYDLSICEDNGITTKNLIKSCKIGKDFLEIGMNYAEFKKRNISGEFSLKKIDSKYYFNVIIEGKKVDVFEMIPADDSRGWETMRKGYGEAAALYNKYAPDPIPLF